MDIKVHLISLRELLENPPQLFKLIKKPDPSSSIEVIRFDEPDVTPIIHFFTQGKLTRNCIFVFFFSLMLIVMLNALVNFHKLTINFIHLLLYFDFLNAVVVLTKTVNFINEIL